MLVYARQIAFDASLAWRRYLLIYSFTHLLIYSFTHLLIYSFTHLTKR